MKIVLEKKLNQFHFSLDLTVNDEGICVIFGRSGSGKTTLINMLAGIDNPDSGYIQLKDQIFFDSLNKINTATNKRNIGYVFQQPRLFPHLNVEKNLRYGYEPKLDRSGEFYQKIIALLGLAPFLKSSVQLLSGGEMQRVAIGRAILSRPKLLLMDEPLTALDLPKKRELLPYLQSLNKALALPIIYVTHSLDEVLFLADEMVLLEQGRCVLQGDVETVWNAPKMLPWLSTSKQCSIINTSIAQQHPNYPLTALSLGSKGNSNKTLENCLWVNRIEQPIDTPLHIRVYAKDVSITTCALDRNTTSIRNILPAKIQDIIIEEQQVKIKLDLHTATLWSQITRWAFDDLALAIGQTVFAQIKGVSIREHAIKS